MLESGAVDKADSDGDTALLMAVMLRQTHSVRALLSAQHGRSWLDAANKQGWTALSAAAKNGDAECVQLLLKAGADTTLRGWQGKTALDWAKENDHADVIALLDH